MTNYAKPVKREGNLFDAVTEFHQSNVVQWIKDNKDSLRDLDKATGKTRWEIDGRFWEVHDVNSSKGGVVLKSKWTPFHYFVEWIPHEYGQYGKIEFHRVETDLGQSVEEGLSEAGIEF